MATQLSARGLSAKAKSPSPPLTRRARDDQIAQNATRIQMMRSRNEDVEFQNAQLKREAAAAAAAASRGAGQPISFSQQGGAGGGGYGAGGGGAHGMHRSPGPSAAPR